MLKRLVVLLVAAAVIFAPGSSTADASDTLDQSFVVDNGSAYVYNGTDTELAQTFQAGLTGGISEVKLKLNSFQPSSDSVGVHIWSTSNNLPGAPLLGTSSIPAIAITSTAAFVSAYFSPPV